MERQLKERLIGAAVLVAVAVIMVPEMFSGSGSRPASTAATATPVSQLKTYRIELQSSRQPETPPQPPVAAPAERPQDELPAAPSHESAAGESSSTPAAVEPAQAASTPPVTVAASTSASSATFPAKPLASAPETHAKPAGVAAEANWVVQIGSFGTQDKARQIATQLKAQGHAASVGPVSVNGKTLYRVRVGAAAERPAAEAALQKLKSAYPGASVVPANR